MTTTTTDPADTRVVVDVDQDELVRIPSSGDPARAAHIVMVPDHLKDMFPSPQAYVLAARINGTAVEALCGFTWVPSQNPENLPICTRCLEIYQQPGEHRDTRDELPEA